MGGAVSTGEDNDDLVDNLVEHACITSGHVEHVFRAVDRGHYFTEECKDSAYKDTAWRSDNLHLSAPCIYSPVMENLELKPGHSFLNIGSGTGYVSTMAGLIIGSRGVNHGVELFQDVIDYAHQRLAEFMAHSNAVDQFDFCPPQFVCGNGLLIAAGRQYDRVYCGARCPHSELPYLKQLLKVGGILVVPVNDHLKRIERLSDDLWDVQDKLSVSFAGLIEPKVSGHKTEVVMPPLVPASLQQLCRTSIRRLLRKRLLAARPQLAPPPPPPPPPLAPRPQGARRRRPPGRRAQQARRIQQLVMPLLDAAVAEDDDNEPVDEQEQRRQSDLGQLGQIVYGAVAHIAGRPAPEDGADEPAEQHSDHSEDAYVELVAADESSSTDGQPETAQQQQQETVSSPAEQQGAADPGPDQQTAGGARQQGEQEVPDRASLKRSSDGQPTAGAGPSDTQKRGRRDKFDSGLGDSPPPALPPRDHSEPENGVAASSDEDEHGEHGGRRPLVLLPPPSRWGGRWASARAGFASELSRFLAAGSDDDELEDLESADGEDAGGGARVGCVLGVQGRRRQRRRRHGPRPGAVSGQLLAEQMQACVAALPLPLPLRLYVNLDRPF